MVRFWWIVCPLPGRIHIVKADNEIDAAIEAGLLQGRLIREAQ